MGEFNIDQLRANKEQIANVLIKAYGHFCVWQKINYSLKIPSKKNTFNNFKHLFKPTSEAHFKMYIIELYKLFETEPGTINIGHIKNMTCKDLKVSKEQKQQLKQMLVSIKPTTEKIRLLRHNFCHNLIEIHETSLNMAEVETLFETVTEILNIISIEIEGLSYGFSNLKQEVELDIERLILNLQNYEPHRLSDIKKDVRKKQTFFKIFQTDREIFNFFRKKL